jgi:hypothetical protein
VREVQPTPARTITLGGSTYTEKELGPFITWQCRDYVSDGRILVEVGRFANEDFASTGFVLYDGSAAGEATSYQRKGVNQRWDWGPNGSDFAFVLKPDGTGLFYDFSNVPQGETTKANDVYKCTRMMRSPA